MTGLLRRTAELDTDLLCLRVVPVTHDVLSFEFAAPSGRPFVFDAGQYVTVAADVDGRRLERCYTISSPSTRPDRLTITVKRVPGGPVSNWLHDRFRPGHALPVTGPLGRFTTSEHPAARYLFLSAGSGVTPMMSMTRTLLDEGRCDVVFVHSARTPHDIVFRSELERFPSQVRVTAICENDAAGERWTGPRGRLSASLLRELVPDLHDREVFVCGPPPYRDAVRGMLRAAAVDPVRCHEESFVLGGSPAPPAAVAPSPSAPSAVAVEFRRSGRTVRCEPGDTVLQAGLRAGVTLPSSCGEGMCGTCRTPLLTGHVDMQHHGGIRPRQVAAGDILLCCSTPLDDLVLDA